MTREINFNKKDETDVTKDAPAEVKMKSVSCKI